MTIKDKHKAVLEQLRAPMRSRGLTRKRGDVFYRESSGVFHCIVVQLSKAPGWREGEVLVIATVGFEALECALEESGFQDPHRPAVSIASQICDDVPLKKITLEETTEPDDVIEEILTEVDAHLIPFLERRGALALCIPAWESGDLRYPGWQLHLALAYREHGRIAEAIETIDRRIKERQSARRPADKYELRKYGRLRALISDGVRD
jgi:hypothetical protein